LEDVVIDGKMTDGESKKEGDRESYVLHITESCTP